MLEATSSPRLFVEGIKRLLIALQVNRTFWPDPMYGKPVSSAPCSVQLACLTFVLLQKASRQKKGKGVSDSPSLYRLTQVQKSEDEDEDEDEDEEMEESDDEEEEEGEEGGEDEVEVSEIDRIMRGSRSSLKVGLEDDEESQ